MPGSITSSSRIAFGRATSVVARLTCRLPMARRSLCKVRRTRRCFDQHDSEFRPLPSRADSRSSISGVSILTRSIPRMNATATNSTLTLSNVTSANQGFYDVIITNIFGATSTPPAQLFVTNGASPFHCRSPEPARSLRSRANCDLGTITVGSNGVSIDDWWRQRERSSCWNTGMH